jgi:RNA polymerase sigma factor (sigma-70 family)
MLDLDQPPGNESSHVEFTLSFEVLYKQYCTRVYQYLRAHLNNDEDASDLTQQVFFQVWLHLYSYRVERGSLATWILSIAHHRLVDFYRAARCSVSWNVLPEMTAIDLDPEAQLISTEELSLIKGLLDALSPFERNLLALRFVARLPIAKIAALLGKSEEATKKQLARLIRRLQEQYRRHNLENLLPDLLEPVLAISLFILEAEHIPLPVGC